ncbi:BMP family ABC transporter substrate-binding protein [Pelagibius sp. Alg239-R121]|uniref:BMP family ABC transporter substrate-binding protein n=1 Tax=Pelagibius sp. Alg239-R121 TaxID=2993448 RepID=UPI0024A6D904|nr:BMP family ABC transporter substrate-binding protein [Pelagibius sp. Alg239-R121]
MIQGVFKTLGATVGAAALGFAVTLGAASAEPTKVGFVYVGPIGDHGWTYRHDKGRLAIEEAFGDKVETSFVESVPEGADAERVIRKLASSGHDLIFTTSFGYMNPTVKVAKQFPNVKFEHATGYKRTKNVGTYAARFYEGRTIAGILAGRMTKSNVIGYIGSFPIPEVVRGINAFTLALRKVNPEAEVKVVWVNSWYDPGKEGDAAKALIDQGADVILQHTDSPAPLQVAQERGVFAVGQASDMTHFGPKAHLTSIVDIWDGYYIAKTKAVMEGTWSSEDTWGGLNAGMLSMATYNEAIPAEVVAEAEAARVAIEDGSLHPFQGPIMDQDGKEVVAADAVVEDGVLLSMDWYVQGVQGKLPK